MTSKTSRWTVLAVLCLSLLAVVIDGTIVNTALPTMARDLDASASDLQWIVDAYTLAFAGLLLVAGAAATATGATARSPRALSSSARRPGLPRWPRTPSSSSARAP